MAYQIKTTGIAANCTMCIAVDPDTGAIQDFASSTVTADMTIGANVTTGSQTWDGNTRSYFVLGSGTTAADFVAFGTNKPTFQLNSDGMARTVVFIGEAAGALVRLFGDGGTQYFASRDIGSGGNTYPSAVIGGTNKSGGNAPISSGNKVIFGHSMVRGASGSTTAYAALHDAASMTVTSGLGGFTGSANYTLDYIGRRDDSTTHQQDKIHAMLIFSSALSEAEWDSLRDDWFGTLLESAGGGGYTLTCAQGSYTITGQAAGAKVGRKLAAGQGTYTLTGSAANLLKWHVITCAQGSYTLTGSEAYADYAITCASGSYTLSGQAAGTTAARKLAAAQGSYTLTGQDVALLYTTPGAYSLAMGQGTYTLTGQAAALQAARRIVAEHGLYALTGQAAALQAGRKATLAAGAYALTGQAITLDAPAVLTAAAGSYALSGQAVTLTYAGVRVLSAPPAGRRLQGYGRPANIQRSTR